jgi:hypothetical protein
MGKIMRKIFVLAVVCLFTENCSGMQSDPFDFSGCVVVNLCTVYRNWHFSNDFVYSLSRAVHTVKETMPTVPVFNFFAIDASLFDDDGIRDRVVLIDSCLRFGLSNTIVMQNSNNVGVSWNRILLHFCLEQIVNNQKIVMNPVVPGGDGYDPFGAEVVFISDFFDDPTLISDAAGCKRLFFQFLDTDDIIHPQEPVIALLAAQKSGASAVNLEYTIRKFGKYSVERLEGLKTPVLFENFRLEEVPSDVRVVDLNFNVDGTMEYRGLSMSHGYLPVLFRFDPDKFSVCTVPRYCLNMFLEVANDLINCYGSVVLVIPNNPLQSILYFYRQHKKSALHSGEEVEFSVNEYIEEYVGRANTPEGLKKLVDYAIDCDIEEVLALLSVIGGKIPDISAMLSSLRTLQSESDARFAGLKELMRVGFAGTGHVPGLLWWN